MGKDPFPTAGDQLSCPRQVVTIWGYAVRIEFFITVVDGIPDFIEDPHLNEFGQMTEEIIVATMLGFRVE